MAKVEKTLANNEIEERKKQKKDVKKSKANKNAQPKRSRVKETMSELKKVSWPSIGKTLKQTGMVLSVVLVFTLVTLGIDLLLTKLLELITNI